MTGRTSKDRVRDTDPLTWRTGFYAQLLPEEISEQAAARRSRRAASAAGLAFVAALAALQGLKMTEVAAADADLDAARAQLQDVRADIAELSDERQLLVEVADSVERTAAAMGRATDVGPIVRQLAASLPSNARVTSVTVAQLDDDADEPYQLGYAPAYGTFTLTASAPSRDAVLSAAEQVNELPYVYFAQMDTVTRTDAAGGEPGETWTVTVSGRLTDEVNITDRFLPEDVPGVVPDADTSDDDPEGDA